MKLSFLVFVCSQIELHSENNILYCNFQKVQQLCVALSISAFHIFLHITG